MLNINKRLGENIRELRKKRGLTQEELAFRAKVDFSYLNRIENGRKNPSIQLLQKIARVLNVTVENLF